MNQPATVIIKRSKKGDHGHHGGAWKVAYADFVTAMMAFFLLLWLLNATTEVQKRGISDYFSPSTVSTSTGGAGGLLGGRAVSSPGAMMDRTAVPSLSLYLEPTSGATEGKAEEEGGASDRAQTAEAAKRDAEKALREKEDRRFDRIEKALLEAVDKDPDLRALAENLVIDKMPEGLRVQVIDREGKPMFALGSAKMFERTRKLVAKIAASIQNLPNKVKIAGHTDSLPFRTTRHGYGNWELSGDRAQAARRALVAGGLAPDRIAAVAGRADRDPLVPDDPTSARNRRISIIVLREKPPSAKPKPTPAAAQTEGLKRDWSGPRVR